MIGAEASLPGVVVLLVCALVYAPFALHERRRRTRHTSDRALPARQATPIEYPLSRVTMLRDPIDPVRRGWTGGYDRAR